MTAPDRFGHGRASLELWLRLFWIGTAATSAEAMVAAHRPPGLSWEVGLGGAGAFLPAAWIASGIGTALVLATSASIERLRQAGVLGPTRLKLAESLAASLVVGPLALLLLWWEVSTGVSVFRNPDLGALLIGIGALGLSVAAVVAWMLLFVLGRALRMRVQRPGIAAALSVPGALVTLSLMVVAARRGELGMALLDQRLWIAPLVGLVAAGVVLRLRRGHSVTPRSLAALAAASLLVSAVAARSLSGDLWTLSHRGPWSRLILSRLVHEAVPSRVRSGSRAPPPLAAHPRPCRREAPSFASNLVLVTIETLRADHTSLLGYSRPTTPTLEALAPESVVLERMLAQAPGTRLSVSALLSGTLPSKIRWIP
jgi:Sulfatase